MLGDVNKLFVFKKLLTTPNNVLPLHFKQTFPPINWINTEGEGDGLQSRLPFKIFSTLNVTKFRVLNFFQEFKKEFRQEQKLTVKVFCRTELFSKFLEKIGGLSIWWVLLYFNYHTRAIITRGLYTFYPFFEVHLCTVTFGLMYG